jgi:serine/threonine protein kinase
VPSEPERFGPYLVFEALGKGGMATVHRAELPQRNKPAKQIALKRLLPTLRKELVTQFLDEARVLKYLHHPNIADTYDSGKVFGTYYIAMEYVRGPTLKEVVAHCGPTVGSVPYPIALNLAAQLCDALDHAHNQKDEQGKALGIVHRDITPSNIILGDGGLLKLIDFGLAKATVAVGAEKNVIKGKFAYVAPEYLEGRIDHRADLWAVGILMYELLTSRRLFDGFDNAETMMRVKSLPIPRPSLANPRVTSALDELVMKALTRDPEKRWQSAADMRDALRAVLAEPGNTVENAQVQTWVEWAMKQKEGGDVSGLSYLRSMITPPQPVPVAAPVEDASPPQPPPTPRDPTPPPSPRDLTGPLPAFDRRWLWGGIAAFALVAFLLTRC